MPLQLTAATCATSQLVVAGDIENWKLWTRSVKTHVMFVDCCFPGSRPRVATQIIIIKSIWRNDSFANIFIFGGKIIKQRQKFKRRFSIWMLSVIQIRGELTYVLQWRAFICILQDWIRPTAECSQTTCLWLGDKSVNLQSLTLQFDLKFPRDVKTLKSFEYYFTDGFFFFFCLRLLIKQAWKWQPASQTDSCPVQHPALFRNRN